jgi:glycosyltransferase involved in cell wall biosynthesis
MNTSDSLESLELSVVLPCLNEIETVAICVRKAKAWLDDNGVRGEVIVADNGSTDGSQADATAAGARVVNVSERGYGSALFYGTSAALGQYVIMADADDSYDLANLGPFLAKLREGYDLVMGNRFAGGIKPGAMPWKNRYIGNPALTGIGRLFFRSAIRDFHCGMRGFSLTAFRQMKLQTTGMEYASEMVIRATVLGLKITEVPTTLSPDGRSRPPHLRPWRDGWRHLRFMLLYSPYWALLYPGLALMLVGLIIGGALLPRPLAVGSVVFDIHTILYAMLMIIVGFQSVTFALLARVHAVSLGLLPPDRLQRWVSSHTLELGLIGGVMLICLGLGGTFFTIYGWEQSSFGELSPRHSLRFAIPSVLAIALGFQTILASFFLGVLGLRHVQREIPSQIP